MTETLIVGGLTVDRFADGSVAPGGSVLHSGLAAVAEGAALTTLTVAGDEPPARDGLSRLEAMGRLSCQRATATTSYRHAERDGARVLLLEARSDPIRADRLDGLPQPAVALVAPIADEVTAPFVDELLSRVQPRRTLMLIQGWLRRLEIGQEVAPLPLASLPSDIARALGQADVIVVSTEDLVESPGDPFGQATALRESVGPRPILVVTLGTEGYLMDDPSLDRVLASVPRRVVTGVPMVGAGDIFGASLAIHLARDIGASAAADRATERVISMLEGRRLATPLRDPGEPA
jgi:sugar/nucleoside kinase (ribokinase family)